MYINLTQMYTITKIIAQKEHNSPTVQSSNGIDFPRPHLMGWVKSEKNQKNIYICLDL